MLKKLMLAGSILALTAAPVMAEEVIGLITKTETNPFFVKMREGAQQKAQELGVKQNWVDSNDLSTMYQATFAPEIYRRVHGLVHHEFRARKSARMLSAVARSPWDVANGASYQTIVNGGVLPQIEQAPVTFEVSDTEMLEITTAMFDEIENERMAVKSTP